MVRVDLPRGQGPGPGSLGVAENRGNRRRAVKKIFRRLFRAAMHASGLFDIIGM